MLINRLNHNIFLCSYVFGHSLCWTEKIFCFEEVWILHSARMKICIFEPFPAYGKVGANPKIFIRYELRLKDKLKLVCFTSFKDQFNPRKWKKWFKMKNFEVVNSAIRAIFTLCHCKNLAAGRWSDFPPEKYTLKYFPKLIRFQLLLD